MTRAPAAAARCSGPVSFEINRSDSSDKRRKLVQIGAPQRSRIEIGAACAQSARPAADRRPSPPRSSRRRIPGNRPAGDLGEVLGGPAFRQPAVLRGSARFAASATASRVSAPTECLLARWANRTAARACLRRRPRPRADPFHGVHAQPRCVDGVGIKPPRPSRASAMPTRTPRPRGRRHERRPQQPLQVDRQVEPASGQLPEQCRTSRRSQKIAARAPIGRGRSAHRGQDAPRAPRETAG